MAVTDESAVDLAVSMATSVAPSAADAGTPTLMQSTEVAPGSTIGVEGSGVVQDPSRTVVSQAPKADTVSVSAWSRSCRQPWSATRQGQAQSAR